MVHDSASFYFVVDLDNLYIWAKGRRNYLTQDIILQENFLFFLFFNKAQFIGCLTRRQVLTKLIRCKVKCYCDATLDCKHEFLGVQHWSPLVLALFTSFAGTSPLFTLAPEVGAAVHTGYVENGDSFQ